MARAGELLGVRLLADTAVVDETGWDFEVVHVADETGVRWILRIPRRQEVIRQADSESALLQLVGDRVSVPVPRWRVRAGDLIAYRRLPGVPAGVEHERTLRYHWNIDPVACAASYLDPLARMLAELHRIPATSPDATSAGIRASLRSTARRAIAELDVPAVLGEAWLDWLTTDRYWPARPVLTHGDLHPGHTLVDEGNRLCGVLDWANGGMNDPAVDFVDMYYAGGGPVLTPLLEAYERHGGQVSPHLREHIAFRCSFIWARVGLRGIDTDRPKLVDVAHERMRSAE